MKTLNHKISSRWLLTPIPTCKLSYSFMPIFYGIGSFSFFPVYYIEKYSILGLVASHC